jgi:hypothetical protein
LTITGRERVSGHLDDKDASRLVGRIGNRLYADRNRRVATMEGDLVNALCEPSKVNRYNGHGAAEVILVHANDERSAVEIARQLQLDRKTVRKYARAASPEQLLGPNPSSGPGLLGPFKPYLQARCDEGVTATTVLYAEIRARGYRGGQRTLRRFLVGIRGREESPAPPPVPSARQITAWIMRPDDKLTDDDRTGLKDACARCPDLATLTDLAHGFNNLVRQRGGAQLEAWINQAGRSSFSEVRGFATGLRSQVSLDELYDYVYDKVRVVTPNQTPGKWTFGVQGDIYVARRARPVTKPVPLPSELQQAIDHPIAGIRVGAVQELARLMRSQHAGLALAARLALEHLAEDDSRAVIAAATRGPRRRTEAAGGPAGAAGPHTGTRGSPADGRDAAPRTGRSPGAGAAAADSSGADPTPVDGNDAASPPGTRHTYDAVSDALVAGDDPRTGDRGRTGGRRPARGWRGHVEGARSGRPLDDDPGVVRRPVAGHGQQGSVHGHARQGSATGPVEERRLIVLRRPTHRQGRHRLPADDALHT